MPDSADVDLALGQHLRSLREAKGWSRETLARKSGTAPLTILRAEVHGTDPTLSSLTAWADALEVPLAELVDPASADVA